MNFGMGFVIWAATGGLLGLLAGRSEQPPAVYEYAITGMVGAILSGLLWSPAFQAQQGSGTLILFFDFSAFHIFAAASGSTAGFWVHLGLSKLRRRDQTKLS